MHAGAHKTKPGNADIPKQAVITPALITLTALFMLLSLSVAGINNFGVVALMSGYGRSAEDQADRVGLRYAYQAGYDVSKGPGLWQKFGAKYRGLPKALNFFLGDHSVAKDRARNLEEQIRYNYSGDTGELSRK